MSRVIGAACLAAALACTGSVLAETAGSTQSIEKYVGNVVTLTEANRPPERCVIQKVWKYDGKLRVQAQSQQTGEMVTFVCATMPPVAERPVSSPQAKRAIPPSAIPFEKRVASSPCPPPVAYVPSGRMRLPLSRRPIMRVPSCAEMTGPPVQTLLPPIQRSAPAQTIRQMVVQIPQAPVTPVVAQPVPREDVLSQNVAPSSYTQNMASSPYTPTAYQAGPVRLTTPYATVSGAQLAVALAVSRPIADTNVVRTSASISQSPLEIRSEPEPPVYRAVQPTTIVTQKPIQESERISVPTEPPDPLLNPERYVRRAPAKN